MLLTDKMLSGRSVLYVRSPPSSSTDNVISQIQINEAIAVDLNSDYFGVHLMPSGKKILSTITEPLSNALCFNLTSSLFPSCKLYLQYFLLNSVYSL